MQSTYIQVVMRVGARAGIMAKEQECMRAGIRVIAIHMNHEVYSYT